MQGWKLTYSLVKAELVITQPDIFKIVNDEIYINVKNCFFLHKKTIEKISWFPMDVEAHIPPVD